MTGVIDQAIEDYLKAIKVDPNYSKPYLAAISIYVKQNEKKSAEDILEKLKKNITDSKVLAEASKLFI
jgi:tetratricopeptide (TPR) repeat protein